MSGTGNEQAVPPDGDKHALEWLLASPEPGVRRIVRRELLDEDVGADATEVLDGPWVRALLADQRSDGGFGVQHYRKWTGAHWRLVSLVELGVPAGEPRAVAAADQVLGWLERGHRSAPMIDGRARVCGSIPGNGVAVACRLGMADDDRVGRLVARLVDWQWPDGGWNCDRSATGRRSSFHETLVPMWGLHEYAAATGDLDARAAADRAADLLLSHRLFRAHATGEPIDRRWLVPRYPAYWHYDVLQALVVLARMGRASDPRAGDALDVLRRSRLPDGSWSIGAPWWRSLTGSVAPEAVDWGRSGPNVMATMNALRVLRAAATGS